jgi:ASC-1-like (ASCH) protein
MKRDENKNTEDNINYQSKKAANQKNNNIKMAGSVFSLNEYNKYKQAVEKDNVMEVFPDKSIFELEEMRRLYEAEKARKMSG